MEVMTSKMGQFEQFLENPGSGYKPNYIESVWSHIYPKK